jgi:hypothetical protein
MDRDSDRERDKEQGNEGKQKRVISENMRNFVFIFPRKEAKTKRNGSVFVSGCEIMKRKKTRNGRTLGLTTNGPYVNSPGLTSNHDPRNLS